jgi:AcrR family transcriptional regulator
MENLIDVGWMRTSARAVAEQAGVSHGALQYHFPSKAELVEAALDRELRRLRDVALQLPRPSGGERERAALLMDRLWDAYNMPAAPALVEMLATARQEPDRSCAARLLATSTEMLLQVSERVIPGYYARPGFRDAILRTQAIMRGAVIPRLCGATAEFVHWPDLKADLLLILDALSSTPT